MIGAFIRSINHVICVCPLVIDSIRLCFVFPDTHNYYQKGAFQAYGKRGDDGGREKKRRVKKLKTTWCVTFPYKNNYFALLEFSSVFVLTPTVPVHDVILVCNM